MEHGTSRRRIRALDGTSFRFEQRGETLYVNDLPAWVHVLAEGKVALVTERKTMQITGAQNWEIIYGEMQPTKLLAGILQAQLDELRHMLRMQAAERTPQE